MKKKFKEILSSRRLAAGFMLMLMTLMAGGVFVIQETLKVPELPVYTDPVMEASIEEEETPLASEPTVKTDTTKKTTKEKVKLKKAATKTYTKSLPTTKKTTKKTTKSASATVVKETTVATAVKEKYTKKSNVKVVTTTTTTTTVTTTTPTVSGGVSAAAASGAGNARSANYTANVKDIAPMMDSRVVSAFDKLGFTMKIDSSVSYSGYFNAATRSITLQRADATVYHELGHFLAFISGNTDRTPAFQTVYSQEKAKYTAANKAYVTQNSSEYFAESVKDYVMQPAALKSARPQTYKAVEAAMNKVTDAQVSKILTAYGPIWNR